MEVKWGRSGTEPAVSPIPLHKNANMFKSQVLKHSQTVKPKLRASLGIKRTGDG
jgi:hypothetical protein